MGIIIGNSKIKNKNILIPFFDGVTSLAQILIFFLLGLLSFPHRMPQIILPALAIVVILTLVARPIAVFAIMLPFKSSIKQCLLVSWAGLRGAASSVFAIMVISSGANISYDLFHIVFMVSLFSVAIQGTLLPAASKSSTWSMRVPMYERPSTTIRRNRQSHSCECSYRKVTTG